MRSPIRLVLLLGLLAPAAHAQLPERPVAPDLSFWHALSDTTLERLILEALNANHDLRAVEARLQESRSVRAQSALDLVPRVTAVGGYSRQRLSGATFPGLSGRLPDQNVWDAGVQMSWELDVFGRLRRSLQGQGALIASAEHDVRDVEVILTAEVASAYFDLRGMRDRLAVARRNAENQRRTLAVTLDRLEAGSGTALDSERAQAQLSSTLAVIPLLEAEVAAAQYSIGVLLGRPPASVVEELSCEPGPAALPPPLSIDNLEVLVRNRPDVLSAERQHAARSAFAGAARAEYLPRVAIGAVAGYSASAFDAIGSSGTARYAIGPVVSWPLFDLGRVKANADAARASEAEAAARYEQTVLRALQEAETALTTYHRARERVQHLEDAAAASERATELARLRFEEGGTDFLEVLDTERRQLETQDQLAVGRTEAAAWLVAVYRAWGGKR